MEGLRARFLSPAASPLVLDRVNVVRAKLGGQARDVWLYRSEVHGFRGWWMRPACRRREIDRSDKRRCLRAMCWGVARGGGPGP